MLPGNANQFARKYLIAVGIPCSRHCTKVVNFVVLNDEPDRLVGAYACPDNYVSRIVYFSSKPDGAWFETYLRDELGGGDRIKSVDIRRATRHGWEIGREAERELASYPGGVTEYYWTFYPRSDEEKNNGTFLCEKCGKLFVKPNSSTERICSRH
jgi:hypothetical protein